MIVPILGFANVGVSFVGMEWSVLLAPGTIGVLLTTYIACKLKLAALPDHAIGGKSMGSPFCAGSALS